MKKFILIVLSIIYTPCVVSGTGITVPKKDIGFDCEVEPVPKLGKEFTVNVKFWFNEKTTYIDSPRAGATAKIGMFPRQKFISGESLIIGKFDIGKIYSLIATYKIVNTGKLYVGLTVTTSGESDSTGKERIGGYTVTHLRCGFYEIPPDSQTTLEKVIDSTTGLKISIIKPENLTLQKKIKIPVSFSSPSKAISSDTDFLNIEKRVNDSKQKGPGTIINITRIYLKKQSLLLVHNEIASSFHSSQ